MPFHTKIQPIDCYVSEEPIPFPESMKQMPKSRLKRLFERQFSLKNSSEKLETPPLSRGNSGDYFEPSSVCLAKMVLNFIEDNNNNNNGEKQQRCGRSRCSCFTGSGTESSDDECDDLKCSSGEACEFLKSLVLCTSVYERDLMAHVTKIVETNKNCKRKDETCLKIVANGLVSLGFDAAMCKSRWEKSPSRPAGEYEYVDVNIQGERLLIDIDFKSNFEIARPTKTYKSILQTLPYIFVGKEDRLQRIIGLICKAAKQSLKKKGLHVPPWRRAEYVKSKWMSFYVRVDQNSVEEDKEEQVDMLTKSESQEEVEFRKLVNSLTILNADVKKRLRLEAFTKNTTNRKEAMEYTGNKLKKHNLEAEKRLKKVEKDYLHTSQKYTETDLLRSYDEMRRARSLCSWAEAFMDSCNKLVEILQEALDKLPTTETSEETIHKPQCLKLDCDAIHIFREINRELYYIQRKMPRSDSRKSVHGLLKEVKEKNKSKDKALSNCIFFYNSTSHDSLRRSVELEIKVLKKLIRELQKDWEEKLHSSQCAKNVYSNFKRMVKDLEKKKEHLLEQWEEEKKYMLGPKEKHDDRRIGTYPEAEYIKMVNDIAYHWRPSYKRYI